MDSASRPKVKGFEPGNGSSESPHISSAEIEAVLFELGRSLNQLQLTPQPPAIAKPGEAQASTLEDDFPTIAERYRVLVEQIPAVVFMAYLDGGVSEAYVSPHIEQMLGFSREEWLDDPIRWYQQIHPQDRDRWSVEAAEMFLKGTPLKSVYRVLARDGRVVWFHCEAKLVRRTDGEPWFIHGVGFDVTDLKETEQALQREIAERERLQKLELQRQIDKTEQSESRLAAIVESSEDAIIGKTLDGIITSWNASATRLFGYGTDEILGKSVLLIVPQELHQAEFESLRKLQAGKRIEHKETQRLTKNGERLDILITISPIKDASGNVIGASSIMRDIRERKRAEERLRVTEKLAATGRLAATIAHEINNPLEAVTNLIYLAKQDESLSSNAQQYLNSADAELQRVAHIARQTLGFYRDNSIPIKIDIPNALSSVLEMYDHKIKSSKLHVQTCYDRTPMITGKIGEIRQVFSNLIANAIDACSAEGQIVVRVASARNWRDSGEIGVRITVADNGRGIPPNIRPKLFVPFFTTKQHLGTGLGLWVSKSLVEKHGGYIRFRSSIVPNRSGSTFSIFLPQNDATQADLGRDAG
jgi:PAS domain S-box-containing protein